MKTGNKKSLDTMPKLLRRAMREKRISSYAQLARHLRLTRVAVGRWGKGIGLPSKRQAGRLAEYLGIPMETMARAWQLSWLIHRAPLFEHELRRYYRLVATLDEKDKPVLRHQEDEELPLLHPRRLPTTDQKFRIDPDISCGLMGPIWAVCDRLKPVRNGDLAVVLVSQRIIRFDRYSKRLYKGMPAYRVTAILPKE